MNDFFRKKIRPGQIFSPGHMCELPKLMLGGKKVYSLLLMWDNKQKTNR